MAKRKQTQAKRGGGIPAWMFLLVGLLIGVIAAGIYFLRAGLGPAQALLPTPDPQAQAPNNGSDGEPLAQEPERAKPKFDFYTVLPEKEVIIPDNELAEQAQTEANNTTQAPAPTTQSTQPAGVSTAPLLLQAGAFRNSGDAEALKARIALSGEVARVESATINGQTVYRVRLGPYGSASTLDAAKRALADNGVDAVAIRVK